MDRILSNYSVSGMILLPRLLLITCPSALGYSACFLSALNLSASQAKIKLPDNVKCAAHVDIGPPASGNNPFGLAVHLKVSSDAKGGEDKKNLEKAVEKAHQVYCTSRMR